MALIKCPECGKEVSSQLKRCNNCGYKLKTLDKKKAKKFVMISIVLVVLIVIVSAIGININKNKQEKLDKEYQSQLIEASQKMYLNGLISSLYCYDIGQVWYNTIFKKSDSKYNMYTKNTSSGFSFFNSDFNTSIQKYLYLNSDKMENLKNEQKEIKKIIVNLQDKPNKKYKEAYDKMIELYGSFNNLVEQATSPSGTYRDYISKYNQYSEDLNTAYEQLVILIPEIKEYKEADKNKSDNNKV